MKEERLKILEMLQEGKITAEDAVKLLEALGDTEEESEGEPQNQNQQRRRRRQRSRSNPRSRSRQFHINVDDFGDEFSDIQDEVQERIREARETLRASMPRVKRAVRDAMPEVNRIVKEATRSMPDVGKIIQEAMQSASDAFSGWTENEGERHPEKNVRKHEETTPIQLSDRLAVRTPQGHIASEIWDHEEVQVEAIITVRGTDKAA
ncbi:MAG: hypothetical protein QGG64_16890, partial [Candidatus Latescibacteria bacterium]|nr:hypothetical protein [Candidatus Latescibacterota bacterium]